MQKREGQAHGPPFDGVIWCGVLSAPSMQNYIPFFARRSLK